MYDVYVFDSKDYNSNSKCKVLFHGKYFSEDAAILDAGRLAVNWPDRIIVTCGEDYK